jgi:hypothetical protein
VSGRCALVPAEDRLAGGLVTRTDSAARPVPATQSESGQQAAASAASPHHAPCHPPPRSHHAPRQPGPLHALRVAHCTACAAAALGRNSRPGVVASVGQGRHGFESPERPCARELQCGGVTGVDAAPASSTNSMK